MKQIRLWILAAMTVAVLCSACGKKETDQAAAKLDTSENVTLKVCGPWTDYVAMEHAAQKFNEAYPNCEIQYEYLQNFDESAVKRLEEAPDTIDFIICGNIQSDSPFLPYMEDIDQHAEVDLSDTNPALIDNFTLMNSDQTAEKQLYCVPLGGELRGLYANKTLLASLGLSVPTNAEEFLAACQVLKDAGYIPANGNPGMFGQQLMYPYIANLIANAEDYQKTYDQVNQCEPGISELFRKPLEFLYNLMEQGYYNYKYVETELNMFVDTSNEGQARDFFHIVDQGNGFEKVDDIGTVAFMIGTYSQQRMMEKTKEDYHSSIDYEFVLSPVSEEGGFAYLSPAHGIGVNKNSSHLDWCMAFMNFLFEQEENIQFTEDSNYIPNTKNSLDVIHKMFDVPDQQISDLGQMTFDYSFFNIVNETLINISKGNNPKYMDTDANGNQVLYSFDYYMEQLESAFTAQRESLKGA